MDEDGTTDGQVGVSDEIQNAAVADNRSKNEEELKCLSACKFDPLSRGIGVQN